MAKVCPRCGKKNRNNARFCNDCSARFPIDSVMTDPASYSDIFECIRKNDHKAVKAFISRGDQVNKADDDGYTPLHWAAENGYRTLARMLIKKGADVGARTLDGWTPLDLARTEGHREMMELIQQQLAEKRTAEKRKTPRPMKKKA